MLVLTRKQGQSILIGDNIEVSVLEIAGDKVRIAIRAPKEVAVLRQELAEAQSANREAAQRIPVDVQELSGLQAMLLATAAKEEK